MASSERNGRNAAYRKAIGVDFPINLMPASADDRELVLKLLFAGTPGCKPHPVTAWNSLVEQVEAWLRTSGTAPDAGTPYMIEEDCR